MKMMGSLGSFCGPFLIGALSDEYEGSFVAPVLLLSGLLLLASVLHFLFREPGKGFLSPQPVFRSQSLGSRPSQHWRCHQNKRQV